MAEYRVFVLGPDGRPESLSAFACDTDRDAVVRIEQLMEERPIELWSGNRLVRRLDGRRKAVSHVVQNGRMVPKPNT